MRYVCFVLMILFAGCAPDAGRDPATFVIGIESPPATLDPRLASDAYSSKICQLVYSGLFQTDSGMSLVPDLISSYSQLTPTTYKFTIKKDILFHDGARLTTKDIAWTYDSIRKRAIISPHYATFSKIVDIEAVDDTTLKVRLSEPFAPFLDALTMGIVPYGVKDSRVGTGPFEIENEVAEEKVVLKRFDRYFGEAPLPSRLIFRIMRDDNLRVLELARGRLDLLQNNIPPALIPYLSGRPDLAIEKVAGTNYSYLGVNLEDPWLRNQKVRQAIAHAIDVQGIIDYKLNGNARPATGILAPTSWAYSRPESNYPWDPSIARRLLDEAGFQDPDGAGPAGRFTIVYKTSTKRDRVGIARLIANYLKDVGIRVVVKPYEWGTLYRDIREGNFQIYSLTWVGVTDPDIYYYVFHSSQFPPSGANRNRYVNGAVDTLTATGRKTLDARERKEIYKEVQEIVADELPYINLWYEDTVVARGADIKGYELYPNGSFAGLRKVFRK